MPFSVHESSREVGNETWHWDVHRLWELSKDFAIEVVPISEIRALEENCWFWDSDPTCIEIARHAQRIYRANMRYPILLAADGSVFDGMHRLCKGYLRGQTHVRVRRFYKNPPPDRREQSS